MVCVMLNQTQTQTFCWSLITSVLMSTNLNATSYSIYFCNHGNALMLFAVPLDIALQTEHKVSPPNIFTISRVFFNFSVQKQEDGLNK